jgi:hypothetical protein
LTQSLQCGGVGGGVFGDGSGGWSGNWSSLVVRFFGGRMRLFGLAQRIQSLLVVGVAGGLCVSRDGNSNAQATDHYAKLSVNHT